MRVLVVGKAKTGTTALMSLVRQSIAPCELVMEPRSVVPFAKESRRRDAKGVNEVIKVLWEHFADRRRHLDALVHGEFGFDVDKVVFISRDVRDEMVSKLLYHAKIARDDGLTPAPAKEITARWVNALKTKERDPHSISFRGLCGIFDSLYDTNLWSRLTAINEKQEFEQYIHGDAQRDYFVFPYEDMVNNRVQALSEYLGVPMSRDMENVNLGKFGYTKRSGRTGSWRSFFTPEDVEILRPLVTQMLTDPLYDDWELDSNPQLSSSDVSDYVARIAAPKR